MAIEYRLSYTASEVNKKLEQVDINKTNINQLSKQIDNLKESGVGGVSSWNDLTDKPFSEESGEVVLLEETNLTPLEGQLFLIEKSVALEKNKLYKVTYNGVEYECVCFIHIEDGENIICLGNGAIIDDEDTGEPFLITNDGEIFGLITMDETTNVTLGISCNDTVVHQLDKKFIPSVEE